MSSFVFYDGLYKTKRYSKSIAIDSMPSIECAEKENNAAEMPTE